MLITLLWFSFLIVTAYLSGYSILETLSEGRVKKLSSDSSLVFSCGLAVLSYAVYLVGILGFFYKNVIIFMVVSLFGLGLFKYVSSGPRKIVFPVFNRFELFLSFNALFFIIITFFGAIAPAIGTDSLCYHLGIPRYFLLQHRISFIPYTMNSLYPFFSEMLFSLGVILNGAILAKLFHWFSGAILAMAVYSLSWNLMGKRAGLLAALICISSPGIFNEMVYAYVDVFLSLYTFLAVMCMVIWTRRGEKSSNEYLILSAVFTGIALSIKYLALFFIIPLFMVLLWDEILRKTRPYKILKHSLIFVFISGLLSFFWYLKAYIVLGNPVFPAMADIFKTSVSFDVSHHFDMGRGKDLISLLRLPWDLAVHPGIYGGRGSQIGMQFSIFLPLLFLGLKRSEKWVRYILFITGFYVLAWFFSVQRDRFLYPVLPLLSVLLAFSFYKIFETKNMFRRIFIPLSVCAFAVTTFFNMGICLYHNRHNYKVALGIETQKQYLKRWVTNYETAEFINKNIEQQAKILGAGIYKVFYFDRWIVRGKLFDLWEEYSDKYHDMKEIKNFLKKKGFTHILLKRINNKKIYTDIELIIEGDLPIFVSQPVRNIESGQTEQFFLYKL